jgi:hypothetical protein
MRPHLKVFKHVQEFYEQHQVARIGVHRVISDALANGVYKSWVCKVHETRRASCITQLEGQKKLTDRLAIDIALIHECGIVRKRVVCCMEYLVLDGDEEGI